MKRIAGMLAATAALFSLGAAPAAADYHGACPGGTGSGAFVDLTVSSGTLTYSGTVNCNGATSISIDSLTLTDPDGNVFDAGSTSCGPCNQLTHSATAPVGATGDYVVRLNFTVVGAGRSFRPSRVRTWSWDGTNLVPVGGGTTPGPFDFCDGTAPIAMESEFHNENGNTTDPLRTRISARLECHGADRLAITLLSVRRQGVSGNTLRGPPRNAPQVFCDGCSELTTSGTFPTDGPGRYRLTFQIAVTEDGVERRRTVATDYLSFGAGPVHPLE